jgi:hypothetical protein
MFMLVAVGAGTSQHGSYDGLCRTLTRGSVAKMLAVECGAPPHVGRILPTVRRIPRRSERWAWSARAEVIGGDDADAHLSNLVAICA